MLAQARQHGAALRRFSPGVEGLESRELLSARTAPATATSRHAQTTVHLNLVVAPDVKPHATKAAATRDAAKSVPPTRGQQVPTPRWVSASFLQSLVSQLHGSVTTTQSLDIGGQVFPPGTYETPQPTPAEIHRETYWATFSGTYTVGPPRFSNQSKTIHIFSDGKNTVSNQALRGRSQLILFPPADPTAQPTTADPVAGQSVGLLSLFTADFFQTSDNLFLDLTTSPNYKGGPSFSGLPNIPADDPSALNHGLPSKLYFLLDSDGGGGYTQPAYATTPAVQTSYDPSTGQFSVPVAVPASAAGAVGFTTGSLVGQGVGMVQIKYFPSKIPQPGAEQSGTVVVRIQGLINMPGGILNATARSIN